MRGKITKGVGGLYTVYCDGKYCHPCRARGHFRHEGISPEVGDNVEFNPDGSGGYTIDEILERRNLLIRPPIANLNLLFVVIAAKSPRPNFLNTDKLISIACHNEIETVLIITKSDLDIGEAERIEEIYAKSGFTSLIKNDEREDELRDFIISHSTGKTSVFAGVSGVGKSTIMNCIFPELDIKTGSVSERTERGRHTTRHVELFPLEILTNNEKSGYIADTPGFSMLDFLKFDYFSFGELPYTFSDFTPYLTKCRYTGCTHTKEDECAILEAIEKGSISKSRHESYTAMYSELKNKREWNKKS